MLNQTLEELALNILIEGEFDTLPIKITHLAKVNRVDYLNNFEHEKFENCMPVHFTKRKYGFRPRTGTKISCIGYGS